MLAEFSLLEFQTKETCTLPEMREFILTPSKNNHKPLQYIIYKPFLYLSGIGREVSCVVTAICTSTSSILVNKEEQKPQQPKSFHLKHLCITHLNIPQVTSALVFIIWFNIQLNYPWRMKEKKKIQMRTKNSMYNRYWIHMHINWERIRTSLSSGAQQQHWCLDDELQKRGSN